MKLLGLKINKKKLIRAITKPYYIIRSYNKQKVFCIGLNKTGTTSMEMAMVDLGYIIGNQREGEQLFNDWLIRDFRKIYSQCKSAVFFQDAPYSFPYTFIALDQKFPGSKFILTIRDSPEQWYNSVINYHGKLWGNGNIPPTSEDLKNANYIYKGFAYDSHINLHNVPDADPYNKDILIDYYNTHNKNVKDYFRNRKDDLLVLNLANDNAYSKFAAFLKIKTNKTKFPWKNKTDEK